MAKKFHFNPETLQFEQRILTPGRRIIRTGVFVLFCSAVGVGSMLFYTQFFNTPRTQVLTRTGNDLHTQINMLQTQVESSMRQLARIEKRDNFLYRTIFEADSFPSGVRQGGTWGAFHYASLSALEGGE